MKIGRSDDPGDGRAGDAKNRRASTFESGKRAFFPGMGMNQALFVDTYEIAAHSDAPLMIIF